MTCQELYQYEVLEDAYTRISGSPPPDIEERVTDLLNHLIWGSYVPGDDPANDEIVKAAIRRLLHSGHSRRLDPELQALAGGLGMEGEINEDLYRCRTRRT